MCLLDICWRKYDLVEENMATSGEKLFSISPTPPWKIIVHCKAIIYS